MRKKRNLQWLLTVCLIFTQLPNAWSAITLDRTRIIFNGAYQSMSIRLENDDKMNPYLAQVWLENDSNEKINQPLTVVPPIQRINPSHQSLVRINALEGLKNLPQDRETLFYFNVRGIPPRSEEPNTLVLAIQTRIKLFYRPASLNEAKKRDAAPKQLILLRKHSGYLLRNPTPYYFSFIEVNDQNTESDVINPFMIAPFGEKEISVPQMHEPILTFINDYGAQPRLVFTCQAEECHVKSVAL